MRLFIGCFLRIKGYEALKNTFDPLLEGRWIPEGNLHLTFKFLGEVEDVAGIVSALQGLEFPRFKPITCREIGMFGKKILYAGCDDPELARLAEAIDRRLADRFGREKSFIPHVTLMRVRSVDPDAAIPFSGPLPEGVSLEGELKVQLIHSESGRRGPYYHVIREF